MCKGVAYDYDICRHCWQLLQDHRSFTRCRNNVLTCQLCFDSKLYFEGRDFSFYTRMYAYKERYILSPPYPLVDQTPRRKKNVIIEDDDN